MQWNFFVHFLLHLSFSVFAFVTFFSSWRYLTKPISSQLMAASSWLAPDEQTCRHRRWAESNTRSLWSATLTCTVVRKKRAVRSDHDAWNPSGEECCSNVILPSYKPMSSAVFMYVAAKQTHSRDLMTSSSYGNLIGCRSSKSSFYFWNIFIFINTYCEDLVLNAPFL